MTVFAVPPITIGPIRGGRHLDGWRLHSARGAALTGVLVSQSLVDSAPAIIIVPHSTPRRRRRSSRRWRRDPCCRRRRPVLSRRSDPSAPGTSNQNPGRNEARAGIAEVGRPTRYATGVITVAPTRRCVSAEHGVGEDLAGPRGVQHHDQRREGPVRRRVRHHHADGEHEHAEPRRPRIRAALPPT